MTTGIRKTTIIIGGGPAGSVAALCLRKLGREVLILEKANFPRYHIGESLLPGTMSILKRLGVSDSVEAANFTKKPAATFLWGEGRPPWSFTFATPQTAPWVFDHSYQVNRDEFDKILLDAARDRGAVVREGCTVTDVELDSNGGPARVFWKDAEAEGSVEGDFVIDASGSAGVIAKKLHLRRWDQYFRNMAVWSYFKGGKRFGGDLEGNILSVTWPEGWIWLIPLKDDVYSVGVVTDMDAKHQINAIGLQTFFSQSINQCPLAMEVLESAEQCSDVHVVRDWAYDASTLALDRAFLCGDSACFIDPLFSQGVHLATYSGTLAAAAIDHLLDHPEAIPDVNSWYERSYRDAYDRYHKFLAAFYSNIDEPTSTFWSNRRIKGAEDQRFDGKDWFASMTGQTVEAAADGEGDALERHAAALAHLWEHREERLSEDFDENELAMRRLMWASQRLKEQKRLARIRWKSTAVTLSPFYKINQISFRLERVHYIGDADGRLMTAYPMTEEHRELFESLIGKPLNYRELTRELRQLDRVGPPDQVIQRLLENDFLEGFDKDGNLVDIEGALRFGGVGADDDMS